MKYPTSRILALLLMAALSVPFVSCDKDHTRPFTIDDGDEKTETALTRDDFSSTSTWSLIGTLSGSSWDRDFAMRSAGDWHAAFDVAVTSTDEFKFRQNADWGTNYGAGASDSKTSVTVGTQIALTQGGGNIQVAAGTYDIYLAPAAQIAYILPAGSAFTHASEGKVQTGGDLGGAYDPNLASDKKASGLSYQLNVYSFADSDGDGWGDFQGIIDHLDYLDALGVTGIWLSPVNLCQSYHGYDVTDYYQLNPKFGGKNATSAQAEAKLQELCTKAGQKNIAIYLDYVLNHSGDQHPWFIKAKQGDATYRSYYVFSDNPDQDVKQGKVDNFAGKTDPGMGSWHSVAGGNAGYSGLLHFKLDVTSASAPKLTITQGSGSADNSDSSVSWFIYDNNAHRMYKTGDKTFEITLNVNNDWGVLVKDHASDWGDHKWGAKAGDQTAVFGQPKTLVKGDAANNIIFSSDVSWYFASFAASMPDLSYGPYASCENSASFKDLAASADKWIKLGIGGLRLDAVMWIYQLNHDANARFLAKWYDHCNATYKANGGKGDFYMVGEAYDYSASVVSNYYKGLPSNFDFAYYGTLKDRINSGNGGNFASSVAGIVRAYQSGYDARLYSHTEGMYDAIKLTNHDENRAASDFGNHDGKKRLAGAVLLTSPGKPFIYQGEELGYWGVKNNGDEYVRTPILWTKNGTVPTTALNNKVDKTMLTPEISVEAQAADDRSLLQLYRHFAYARNTHPALASGTLEAVSAGNDAIAAWYMTGGGEKLLVMHNFSSATQTVLRASDKLGTVVVSNGGPSVAGSTVTLPAYSSVVFLQ